MKKTSLSPDFKYKLFKITERLYCIEMPNPYDLAMLFVRYQEYYESPNKDVRNKAFDLEQYMRWYSVNNKNHRYEDKSHMSFSYPIDFCGFNIPSSAITNILLKGEYVGSLNMYDALMRNIYNDIMDDIGRTCNGSFYLIGTPKMQSSTMMHEIAHGLYYLNSTYYIVANKLISDHLTKSEIKAFKKVLKDYHYAKEVMYDEIQAYLSTGEMIKQFPDVDNKPFQKHFKEYYKDIKPKLIPKKVGDSDLIS
jgi:hypothetical protein